MLFRSPDRRRWLRYGFDSSQARQTVRWRRFRGPELAPVSEAEPGAFALGGQITIRRLKPRGGSLLKRRPNSDQTAAKRLFCGFFRPAARPLAAGQAAQGATYNTRFRAEAALRRCQIRCLFCRCLYCICHFSGACLMFISSAFAQTVPAATNAGAGAAAASPFSGLLLPVVMLVVLY